MKQKYTLLVVVSFLFVCLSMAQQSYVPTNDNLKNRKEFQDMKFGVFIHWGIYSMMADGEWIMNNKNINHNEYAKLAQGFYPSKYDAAKWVADVKASGAKYICITSRHHDGFSMFETKQSPFNIVDATPFKRDIIKELADECHKQGVKLHFYYSLLDWTRNDYYPLGRTGHGVGRTEKGNWDSYHRFMKNQITELLTNYGEIGAIWFDGLWDQPAEFDWKIREIYDLIHSIQPGCMVINNHHLTPLEGEDGQTFEKDLPGQN
ncbi:MAG: alpha-L-fucosidase, partial [Dysgonamonadaceae bacterium]|nr:alpha-L-fucosidase [Dysgonamonadaceae bacterium]